MVDADGQMASVQPIDEATFLTVIQPLLPVAQRLAHGMLRSPSEAEDIVQEATLKAWAKIRSFHIGSDLKAWYLTIVANECRQTLRSRWWHEVRVPFVEDATPGRLQDQVVTGDEVRRALNRLTYDHRLVIVLRFYLDLSFEEIGRTLRISPQTARSRTHRALARLRPIFNTPEVLGNE
jgi:RNA polymerase sigma-70 factor (ECF subfamily)